GRRRSHKKTKNKHGGGTKTGARGTGGGGPGGGETNTAISPSRAGQAKRPGSTPYAYRPTNENPAHRQPWIAVTSKTSPPVTNLRKAADTQSAPRNTRSGTVTPRAIGKGSVPGVLMKAPPAPRRTTTASHTASTTATTAFRV